jgi:type II secretory pathway pseudopilin PulG
MSLWSWLDTVSHCGAPIQYECLPHSRLLPLADQLFNRLHAPPAVPDTTHRAYPSALPSRWGPLLAAQTTNTRSGLTLVTALTPGAQSLISTSAAPAAARTDGGRVQLGPAGVAGIAIGCAAVVVAVGGIVFLGMKANRKQDTSKSAQLAYINEMTEADMAEAEEREAEEAQEAKVELAVGAAAGPGLPTSTGAAAPRRSTGGALAGAGGGLAGLHAAAALSVSEDGRRSSNGAGGSGAGAVPTAGVAFASLKQRHLSSAGGSGSFAPPPVTRTSGANGSGAQFGAALSKLGSTVAGYVAASAAPAELLQDEKDK